MKIGNIGISVPSNVLTYPPEEAIAMAVDGLSSATIGTLWQKSARGRAATTAGQSWAVVEFEASLPSLATGADRLGLVGCE